MYTSDRYCNPNSAVYLNKGYLQAPPGNYFDTVMWSPYYILHLLFGNLLKILGVYFGGDYTINVWIWIKSWREFQRILDFSNGPTNNNIQTISLRFNVGSVIASIGADSTIVTAENLVKLNQWYMLTTVLRGSTGYIYLNGLQIATGQLNHPRITTRQNNFFGKSLNAISSNLDAILDDIEIHDVALSASDIDSKYQSAISKGTKNL